MWFSKFWLESNICCHVYGAEQDSDHDQNQVRKKTMETRSVKSVMTETVVDLRVWDVVVAAPGPLRFRLL